MTPALADQIASWRRIVNGRSPSVDAQVLLRNAAQELWTTLDIDRTVHPDAVVSSRQEAIDALQDMAQISGIDADDAQAIFAECFKKQPANGAEIYDFQTGAPLADNIPASPVTIKSSQQFVAGFVPPDYIVDGLMQEAFLYSLTGATGAGKTAITLRLAASVASGKPFADRKTKKKRVLYLAAENPDDVRMRWIALSQHMDFDLNEIDVFFIEGVFKISQMADSLKKEADRIGGEFGLVIIDTGPVFYEGDDENNRTQQGNHAKMLRDLITLIPGKPTVVANCHPVKNAAADNLVPAGGGNFLNQVDGNLTVGKKESSAELHWQGKFRGADFAPLYFQIKTVTHERLKDSLGGLIPTVISTWLTDTAKEQIDKETDADQRRVLAIVANDRTVSLSDIAKQMRWKPLRDGTPNKVKAGRYVKELTRAGWLDNDRRATTKGQKVLSESMDAESSPGIHGRNKQL
jgi:AAA domain-containing protein